MRNLFLPVILFLAFISNAQSDSIPTQMRNEGDKSTQPGTNDEIIITAEEMPEFPGGEAALFDFIYKNLIYPDSAKIKGIEGRIRVQFTVTYTGEIKDAHIIGKDKLGYGCEEAAIAVVMKMPKWKPGKQNGEPVNVYFNLPIMFKLF